MSVNIACTCDCSPLEGPLLEVLGRVLGLDLTEVCNWLPYGSAASFVQEPLRTFPPPADSNTLNVLLIQLEDLTVVHPEVRDLPSRKTKLTASVAGSSRKLADEASAQARGGSVVALDLSVGSHRQLNTDVASASSTCAKALQTYSEAAENGGYAPLFVVILPHRPSVCASSVLEAQHREAEAEIQSSFAAARLDELPIDDTAGATARAWQSFSRQEGRWVRVLTSGVFSSDHQEQLYDIGQAVASHSPYTTLAWGHVAVVMAAALVQACAPPLKAIACDCDNTLWGGAIGELGPHGVALRPGRFAWTRAWLRRRAQGGFVCSLLSKNEPADVTSAFETIPTGEMGFTLEDHIAAVRASWEPKPRALRGLAADTALGLESFAFVDDSPVECATMGAELPEVRTVQLPPPPKSAAASGGGSSSSSSSSQAHPPVDVSQQYANSLDTFTVFTCAHPYLGIPYKSGRVRSRPASDPVGCATDSSKVGEGSGAGAATGGGSSSSSASSPGHAAAPESKTSTDLRRTKLYQDMERRTVARRSAPSGAAFLASLHLRIDVHRVGADAGDGQLLPRAAQLTLRTNQLNVAKHPLALHQLHSMVLGASGRASEASSPVEAGSGPSLGSGGTHACFLADVTDRFGNYGLVAMALVDESPRVLPRLPIGRGAASVAREVAVVGEACNRSSCVSVDTFLMSCRVLERGVEHAMLRHIAGIGGSKGRSAESAGLDWVCIPWIPADRNEPARQFLFELVPDAVSQYSSGAVRADDDGRSDSFAFVPVDLGADGPIDELVQAAAPRFFLDLIRHIRSSVQIMAQTMVRCKSIDGSAEGAALALEGEGGRLARYLLPERLVAISRRTKVEAERKGGSGTAKEVTAGARPSHFGGIAAQAAGSKTAAATVRKEGGKSAAGGGVIPSASEAEGASRRATLAVASTQVLKALSPSLALQLAEAEEGLLRAPRDALASSGPAGSGVSPAPADVETTDAAAGAVQRHMDPQALETALRLCMSVSQEEAKWASSFAGGAEAGAGPRRKKGKGAVTGKVTRHRLQQRASLAELRSLAAAAKPPPGLVFVRRAALQAVRFNIDAPASRSEVQVPGDDRKSSGCARGGGIAAASRDRLDGGAGRGTVGTGGGHGGGIAAASRDRLDGGGAGRGTVGTGGGHGPLGPHECGDGSLVWPAQAVFDLADACARGLHSPLLQRLCGFGGGVGSESAERSPGYGTSDATVESSLGGRVPRSGHVDGGKEGHQDSGVAGRKRARQGPSGGGAGAREKAPRREGSEGAEAAKGAKQGAPRAAEFGAEVDEMLRSASVSARQVLGGCWSQDGGGGKAGEHEAGGGASGGGEEGYRVVVSSGGDEVASTAAFRELCRLRTAARSEATSLLRRARSGGVAGAGEVGGR